MALKAILTPKIVENLSIAMPSFFLCSAGKMVFEQCFPLADQSTTHLQHRHFPENGKKEDITSWEKEGFFNLQKGQIRDFYENSLSTNHITHLRKLRRTLPVMITQFPLSFFTAIIFLIRNCNQYYNQ
uniref:Uncharacterized protein n=1 Tax=Glossina austeni TaxID=7395 RepID=A0A1A9UEC4_GLOAU